MTSVAELVEQTLRYIQPYVRDKQTTLHSAIGSAGATTIDLTASTGITVRAGDYLAIDYELLYVVDPGTLTAVVVQRGMLGTTAATHLIGAPVYVSPRFARGAVMAALLDDIRSWPRGLYQVNTTTVSLGVDQAQVELVTPAAVYHVLQALRVDPATNRYVKCDLNLVRGISAGVTPQGQAVQLRDGFYGFGVDLYVTYAGAFDLHQWLATTDVENRVGIPTRMHDIAVLGAAHRMLIGSGVQRVDLIAQGQDRDADENPPQAIAQTIQLLRQLRDRRIAEELQYLQAEYGIRY